VIRNVGSYEEVTTFCNRLQRTVDRHSSTLECVELRCHPGAHYLFISRIALALSEGEPASGRGYRVVQNRADLRNVLQEHHLPGLVVVLIPADRLKFRSVVRRVVAVRFIDDLEQILDGASTCRRQHILKAEMCDRLAAIKIMIARDLFGSLARQDDDLLVVWKPFVDSRSLHRISIRRFVLDVTKARYLFATTEDLCRVDQQLTISL